MRPCLENKNTHRPKSIQLAAKSESMLFLGGWWGGGLVLEVHNAISITTSSASTAHALRFALPTVPRVGYFRMNSISPSWRDWYFIAKQPVPVPHMPSHCATYCTPCRPLLRAVSGWILSPSPNPPPAHVDNLPCTLTYCVRPNLGPGLGFRG